MALTSPPFVIRNEAFKAILGPNPTLSLLVENEKYPFAHEAGVFIPSTNELFVTSNQFIGSCGKKEIQISKVTLGSGEDAICEEICTANVPMANGGVNYNDGVLFCAQGTLDLPGGLAFMEKSAPYRSHFLIQDFYGRPFNSVNDVVVHSDGSMWFTDPIYGYEQGIRPKPQLPSQVYRFDPHTGSSMIYVTDTDWIHGDGTIDFSRASTIYAFDLVKFSGQPFLINRRLFAMAHTGVPDGIKCDLAGNLYSGCGRGIHVWSPGGVFLGQIMVEGGCSNFCYGRKGETFILNEHKLWRAQLADTTKGALLESAEMLHRNCRLNM